MSVSGYAVNTKQTHRKIIDKRIKIPKPSLHTQVSNASSEDPGYERVRLRTRPSAAEDVEDTDSEPNYESMPHETLEPNYASLVACRPGAGTPAALDSDLDPNYESVSNAGDPNYESVKYVSLGQPQQQQQQSEEPPYERLASYSKAASSNRGSGGGQDPDYERIERGVMVGKNADTDDEQYVQV